MTSPQSVRSVVVALLMLGAISSYAAGTSSTYQELSADQYVSGGPVTLLSSTIYTSSANWTFVQSDGRYYPWTSPLAIVWIEIDGTKVSNDSPVDWRQSTKAVQHSYNAIGASYLGVGYHTITLRASTTGGAASIGANSNLSVITNVASNVLPVSLSSDTAPLSFYTTDAVRGAPIPLSSPASPLPGYSPILNAGIQTTDNSPLLAFTSGRSYLSATQGDAFWGVYLDGAEPSNAAQTWSDNDMCFCAETQAPMYNQAYFNTAPGHHDVSLEASAETWDEDLPPAQRRTDIVNYKVGAGTKLITLYGGMNVVGNALNPTASYGYDRFGYICIDSNVGWPGCPADGQETTLASSTITIPPGHNGVVMFTAKTRIQAGPTDSGGNAFLYIKIDGNIVSNWGVQQLTNPSCASTRTMAASYLATGANALTPGTHVVQAVVKGEGSFQHLGVLADLPLVWFD